MDLSLLNLAHSSQGRGKAKTGNPQRRNGGDEADGVAAAAVAGEAAGEAAGAAAAAAAMAQGGAPAKKERKEPGREGRRAKHHVAPKDRLGR